MTKNNAAIGLTGLILALSAPVSAINTDAWRVDSAAGGPIFQDGSQRGLAYNPLTNSVLVARTTPQVGVFNGATGAAGTGMNVTGVSGGAVALQKIRVIGTGGSNYSVFASNLTTTRTSALRIYRWAGTAPALEGTIGAPTLLYNNVAGNSSASPLAGAVGPVLPDEGPTYTYRYGDGMCVVKDPNSDAIQIYVSRSDSFTNNEIVRLDGTDNGTVASITGATLITLSGLPADFSFGSGSSSGFWVTGFNGDIINTARGPVGAAPAVFDSTGAFKSMLGGVYNAILHHVAGTIGGTSVVLALQDDPAAPLSAQNFSRWTLAELATPGDWTSGVHRAAAAAATANIANLNGTGDAAIAPDGSVYLLATNSVMLKATYSAPPAGVTKLWNNASGGSWFTASNWTPAGVPTINDNVVLDESITGAGYNVTIDATTADNDAKARTITIGGGPNNVTLTLAPSGTLRLALSLQGAPTGDTLDILSNGTLAYNYGGVSGTIPVHYHDYRAKARVRNGGTLSTNSARSFTGPFPAAHPAGYIPNQNGPVTFEPASTMTFLVGSNPTINGRTYGNLNIGLNMTNTVTIPAVINGTFTISGSAALTGASNGSITLNGPIVYTSTATSSIGGIPLIINSSFTRPSLLTLTANVVVTTGSVFNIGASNTMGGTGRVINVAGELVIPSGSVLTLSGNCSLALTGNGKVTGDGQLAIPANGGLGTDRPEGLTNIIDPPGYFVANVNTTPTVANGNWSYVGPGDQVPGSAIPPGTVGGLTVLKPINARLNLGGDYTCANVLGTNSGTINTGGNILQLGTSTAATGSFILPISSGKSKIQGTFRRWIGTGISGGRDFPLGDAAGNDRWLTIGLNAATAAGGTLTVSYLPGDPGGRTGLNIDPIASTNASTNYNQVDATGIWRIVPANGLTLNAVNPSYNVSIDTRGFNTGYNSGFGGVVRREVGAAANSWNTQTGVNNAAGLPSEGSLNGTAYLLANTGQATANPTHGNVTGAWRQRFFHLPAAGIELGYAGTATFAPVSMSEFVVE